MPVIMALVLLPWVAVVLFTAGGWATLNFIAYAIVVFAAGYSIVIAALPASARTETIFLAPGTGIMAVSALSAFWLRLGLPLQWVPAIWLVLAPSGAWFLWRGRAQWTTSAVPYGKTLVVFSILICAVYFLPSARTDLIASRDGSYHWADWQTQHFHALAASIKESNGPPKSPGTDTAELLYHFGPFAPAAAISRLDSLDLGDAVARVTRGASIWALVLSCFSVGTLLSLKANGSRFGGIMSVAGLFFYGSLLSTFNDLLDTPQHHRIAMFLFQPADGRILADGGPFGHLLMGHSLLHGLGAITVIMGLCLVAREQETELSWRSALLLALPALAVPMNSVAALYCFGVAAILLFWGRLGAVKSWLQIVLMACLFLAAWKIMGFSHTQDAAATAFKDHITAQWWMLVVWLLAGLGFRIIGFRWITRSRNGRFGKDPVSVLVLCSTVALLAFSLLLQLRDNNQHYGIYFLQSLFSIFAFSRVTAGSWRGGERVRVITEWLRIARTGLILLAACGVLIGVIAWATHSNPGITDFRDKILLTFALLALLFGALALMKRSPRFAAAGSALVMVVLMIGFLAWTANLVSYTWGGVKYSIAYPPGVVHGLRRLGELMAPGERFATNKHSLQGDTLQPPSEHSYGYAALSERPVLLEGYLARGEKLLPWFDTLLRDNDLLFTTTDPQVLRDTATTWRVRWLVARPGTDIALPRPLPPWLVEQQDSGDLKIYRID
jgi:hypothetical protein